MSWLCNTASIVTIIAAFSLVSVKTFANSGGLECLLAKKLDTIDRAAGYSLGSDAHCDKYDIANNIWYRISGSAGSAMATSCVQERHCGTHAPGWLSGGHPTTAEGVVSRTVCYAWDGNCCRWKSTIRVRDCGGYYVYELVKPPHCNLRYCGNGQGPKPTATSLPVPQECQSYSILSDADRAASSPSVSLKCDMNDISKKWYRFLGDAGSAMPTKCVAMNHCGTHSPGWLSGAHPSQSEGIVRRTVCFSWDNDCCHWVSVIRVRNCGGFNVYELVRTPQCHLRYCGNGKGGQGVSTVNPAPVTSIPPPGSHPQECKIYITLSSRDRAQGQPRGQVSKCDKNDLTKNWYRFMGDAGTEMASSCVPENHCGTHAPGWMNGDHPTQAEGIAIRRVCYNWIGKCCHWHHNIRVRNCGSFYVYELVRPNYCFLRYCGNAGSAPTTPVLPTTFPDVCLLKPCQNGATCVSNQGKYTCTCKQGFTGNDCELDVDECLTNPCKNGATCVNQKGSYSCSCVPGFTNKHCDKDIDECLLNPCQNGATCVNQPGSYSCKCSGGYTGKKCEDVDECLLNPCQNGATCVNQPGSYSCRCVTGFTGKDCDKDIDECITNPCQNGATCFNQLGSYSCKCMTGFTGTNCEKDVDECLAVTSPCTNGATCVNQKGSYSCSCVTGFTGKHCDKDVDECLTSPCRNGGTCANIVGGYRCTCTKGFQGQNCNIDVDECMASPCKNGGKCNNLLGSYTCYCPTGVLGKNCEIDVNECKTFPCKHFGLCENTVGSYKCHCLPGYQGKHCENDIDECLKHPCQNGATCVNRNGGYTCQCPSGFKGKKCDQDVDECGKIQCQNGATCTNSHGGYTCQCVSEFTGKDCEKDVDECLKNPCQNNATCTNSHGGYTCQCVSGFTGKDCEKDLDECLNKPCQNNGTCTNSHGGYTCQCGMSGFTGKDCEKDINECIINPCQNNGKCINSVGSYKCQCANYYTGKHCETAPSKPSVGPTTTPPQADYKKVGCFNDKRKAGARPFPKLLANLRPQIDWNDLKKTVIDNCANLARKQGYKYYGIQFYGECWSGPDSDVKYDRDGPSTDPPQDCPAGVGAAGKLMVYHASQ